MYSNFFLDLVELDFFQGNLTILLMICKDSYYILILKNMETDVLTFQTWSMIVRVAPIANTLRIQCSSDHVLMTLT